MDGEIDESWKPLFDQFEFPMDEIYEEGKEIYPPRNQVFRVFKEFEADGINVVFIFQDPYHGKGQANGLACSVNKDVPIPPTLRNIFKEITSNFPERNYEFTHGDLTKWVNQGIFLLNCSLTVEKGKPGSHIEYWSEFTDDVIKFISQKNKYAIFVLLGNFAKKKAEFIENKKYIITSTHPSPYSANSGFLGSGIFRKIEYLFGDPIDWRN